MTKSDTSLSTHDNYLFEMHQTIDTVMLGDLNFDGTDDTAIVTSPMHAYPHPTANNESGCYQNNCETMVSFSFDTTLLRHNDALGFWRFFATDDLNGDGIREIAFIPNWFHSNWQGLFVYSLQEKQWHQLAHGSVFTSEEYTYENRIRKLNHHEFELVSMGIEMEDVPEVFSSRVN